MKLPIAFKYLGMGFSLIPMHYRSASPADLLIRLNPLSAAQKWEDYKKQPSTMEDLMFWHEHNPKINIGAVLGPVSRGLVRLDFSWRAAECFQKWKELVGSLAKHIPVAESSGGLQAFFMVEKPCESKMLAWSADHRGMIEQKGAGQLCLLPGSLLPNNTVYKWIHLDMMEIPKVSQGEYKAVIASARQLNEAVGTPGVCVQNIGRYWRPKLEIEHRL